MENKEDILKKIKLLQIEYNQIEKTEKRYKYYIGKCYACDNSFIKVIDYSHNTIYDILFAVLKIKENCVQIVLVSLANFQIEITKSKFEEEYFKIFLKINKNLL